jgi:SWI/SNF-related matrix-associated actin-dependent regulator of chromatin subfamily A member 5
LDAAVIQQGRLAEENSKLSKDELMKMVKFGADQILSGNNGTYTDEDIDALIAKGEHKTSLIQAKLKTDAQHNLATFSLLGEDETGKDTFEFGGENYRNIAKNTGTFINLPQRERKRNYNVNEYFRESMQDKKPEAKKRKKVQVYHDFQLFNKPLLEHFENRERDLSMKLAQRKEEIADLRSRAKSAPSLKSSRFDLRTGTSREELNAKADEIEKSLFQFELTKGEFCVNKVSRNHGVMS